MTFEIVDEPKAKFSITELGKDIGIFWREPTNKWERFLFLFFRERRWARRLLGGRWELSIWDKGELHYVLMWSWVYQWNQNKNGYAESVIGREFYRNGISQKFDFGDAYYKQREGLKDGQSRVY